MPRAWTGSGAGGVSFTTPNLRVPVGPAAPGYLPDPNRLFLSAG